MKKIVSLFVVLCCFFITTAQAAEYIQNNQKNYDAYTYTNMVECFKYSTYNTFGDKGGYFGNTAGGECIVYKNMDFGRLGAVNVELSYAAAGNYSGTLEFRKGSADGELIAEFKSENNSDWYTPKTRIAEVEFPAVSSGRFDLYVVIKNSVYGNLYGFKFNKTPTSYQTINAVTSLKDSIGFEDTDFLESGIWINANNPALLGDDYARHLDYYVSFENKEPLKLIIDAKVTSAGRMRIYDNCPDGELLQEIELAVGETEQTFDVSDAIKNLDATQNLCFAFDNSMEMELCNFTFTAKDKLNVEETVFDVSNETSVGGGAKENATFFGAMTSSAAYICWKDVDFGDTAWPMTVTASYGVGGANNGSDIVIKTDSVNGDVIARIPMPMKDGGGWEKPKSETAVLLKEVTGVHDMYVMLETTEYTYTAQGGNIFSIDFEPAKGKYASSYNLLSLNKVPKKLKANVSFLNDEDNPDEMMYSFAIYDSESMLISVDSKKETVTDGINVFERTLDYTSMQEPDDYTVKVFLWDVAMKPINSEIVGNYTINA